MRADSCLHPRSPGTNSPTSIVCSSAWLTRRLADCSASPITEPQPITGVSGGSTPVMGWGSVMGEAEQSARRRVSQALEQTIDVGELVPGERGCKQLSARITEVSLMMPRLDLRGATLLQAVFRERGERWAAGYPALRQDLLTQM